VTVRKLVVICCSTYLYNTTSCTFCFK